VVGRLDHCLKPRGHHLPQAGLRQRTTIVWEMLLACKMNGAEFWIMPVTGQSWPTQMQICKPWLLTFAWQLLKQTYEAAQNKVVAACYGSRPQFFCQFFPPGFWNAGSRFYHLPGALCMYKLDKRLWCRVSYGYFAIGNLAASDQRRLTCVVDLHMLKNICRDWLLFMNWLTSQSSAYFNTILCPHICRMHQNAVDDCFLQLSPTP